MSSPEAAEAAGPLYLGLDLSTQQLKAIVIDGALEPVARATVDFDADLGARYGVRAGVVVRGDEVVAPVAMWLEAVDLVLARLAAAAAAADGADGSVMRRIRAVSGAGQQHGSVFWRAGADARLGALDARRGALVDQLPAALAHPWSPNWQDQSTQRECDAFDAALGGRQQLAQLTGSGAHHRFTGPQIMRLRRRLPDVYAAADRISLVSSWLASVLRGAVAPLDVADVCGMNLWDVAGRRYSPELLALAAGGGADAAAELRRKLGEPLLDGGASLGAVSPYFVARHGLSPRCQVVAFTGDNPATMLALPLRPLDAIVSLGTSTTFLMNTPAYRPDASCHFFHHPATAGHYMFMLCYKNGGLARERVRDELRPPPSSSSPSSPASAWDAFDQAILRTPPLDMPAAAADNPDGPDGARAKLGLYFCLRETVPNLRAGTWRFTCRPDGSDLAPAAAGAPSWPPETDARIIAESQALSLRLRSRALARPPRAGLPAQPRRVYLVGGGSANPALARVLGEVLGGAYKALWAAERRPGEAFDDVVGARWRERRAADVCAADEGFRPDTFRAYGRVLGAFEQMEARLLAEEAAEEAEAEAEAAPAEQG